MAVSYGARFPLAYTTQFITYSHVVWGANANIKIHLNQLKKKSTQKKIENLSLSVRNYCSILTPNIYICKIRAEF